MNCSVTENGGGIYCSNIFNFSLLRCCGYRCTSNNICQFLSSSITTSSINNNQINYSSTLLCGYDHSFIYHSILINNGNLYCSNLNLTKNYLQDHIGGIGTIGGNTYKHRFSTFYEIQNSMVLGVGGFLINLEF